MKAIILAAGCGTRLGEYTKEIPKGLLKLGGKSIIDLQIACYRAAGITDISIVKGYQGEKINFDGVKYYWNNDFECTNMVFSFMRAAPEFTDDIIVSYADIVFEPKLLKQIINSKYGISILVDSNWKKYWLMRYGTIEHDLESLIIDDTENIVEIGRPCTIPDEMHSRYIGILKFSKQRLKDVIKTAEAASATYSDIPWKLSMRPYPKAYMTDLLQALIDNGIKIKAEKVSNGWLEFDTKSDYENAQLWISNGSINELFENFQILN
ncbi:MAG: phosphocholine cytidylyltransferase family protein [Lachnospiraceae bacterium]|nr:phosphocholine cytidylyltransferase family protein [Lachnospiraceae bacterium]